MFLTCQCVIHKWPCPPSSSSRSPPEDSPAVSLSQRCPTLLEGSSCRQRLPRVAVASRHSRTVWDRRLASEVPLINPAILELQ